MPSRLLAILLAAALSLIAHAQPSGTDDAPPPPPPTPVEVLTRVRARYLSGPVCERMRIEVRSDSGRVARSWVVVRTDRSEFLALELGSLRIAADSRTLTAVHERNPQTVFSTALPGEGVLSLDRLWRVIPRVPVPQFDFAASVDAASITSLASYARNIHWHTVMPEARTAPGPSVAARLTVVGSCDGGRVSLTAKGDQLQAIEIRDDGQGVTVRMQISPALPCRTEDLKIDAAGRAPVAQLADLQPRSGVLRLGAAVPEMQLSTAAGQLQRLKDLYTPPAQFLPAPAAERLVLIFSRQARDPLKEPARVGRVELDVVGRELAKLQRQAYAAAEEAPRGEGGGAGAGGSPAGEAKLGETAGDAAALLPTFNFAQVMVLESPPSAESLLGMLKREREAWGGAGGGDHLAWTTNARSSVDLFATSGESLAIVLSPSQRLQAVIPIAEHTTTETVLDQVTASLMEQRAE